MSESGYAKFQDPTSPDSHSCVTRTSRREAMNRFDKLEKNVSQILSLRRMSSALLTRVFPKLQHKLFIP